MRVSPALCVTCAARIGAGAVSVCCYVFSCGREPVLLRDPGHSAGMGTRRDDWREASLCASG